MGLPVLIHTKYIHPKYREIYEKKTTRMTEGEAGKTQQIQQ